MSNPFETPRQKLFGVYPAIVREVTDEDRQARVKVEFPWVDEREGEASAVWARLATMMAGAGRGTYFVPEPDDEVLVSFMHGDPSQPVVVGALWNGVDAPPEKMDPGGQNDVRSVTSRAGHKITFNDGSDRKIELRTNGGHRVELSDASSEVTVEHSNGASVRIDSAGTITVRANAKVKVIAPSGATVQAPKVDVNSPISTFSGIVKAETVITNMVISSAYTPGAGNVW